MTQQEINSTPLGTMLLQSSVIGDPKINFEVPFYIHKSFGDRLFGLVVIPNNGYNIRNAGSDELQWTFPEAGLIYRDGVTSLVNSVGKTTLVIESQVSGRLGLYGYEEPKSKDIQTLTREIIELAVKAYRIYRPRTMQEQLKLDLQWGE